MSPGMEEQINKLKSTIAEMDAQRAVLGDEFVDSTLETLRAKLSDLETQLEQLTQESLNPPTRQRKLVTLLYLDVVGSTAMTQGMDPEDTLEIMDNTLPRLATPIERHGGHVTRYTGDGFKAVFGDPLAREDDPEQAIRSGLEILDLSRVIALELEQEWNIRNFQVRIGIDTGLAALGGQTEAEDTVMGRVVNLAVRIESAAPPGGLLISHNTFHHVRGVFNVEPQELITARGFPEPVPVYLVKEIKPRAFRVQTRGVEGIETRMVGRNDELRFLQDALMTAFEEGEGHVVTISGAAGVGKSRLLYEFQNWLELQPPSKAVRFFFGRGEQESQGNPYNLLRDLFVFRFQILDDESGEQARQKIENGFTAVFGDAEDALMKAHIIGQLLGFDFSTSPHLKGVLNDPEQLRNRGLMYLIQYYQVLSQEIPVVIFLEDIHWADDSSLDIINQLGERAAELPILIVCAARLRLFERRPYWGEGQDYHTLLELHSLSKRESRNLVTEILKLAVDIPAELRELVVMGAEGNPFYTEELIKMLIEDGVVIPDEETWQIEMSRLEEVDVPSTLAGVLQARLDSLPIQERTVLQQASVVGRLFWDRIVTYIQAEGGNGGDPQLIPQILTSLRDRELIYRHEESVFAGSVEYLFKHDILREVTYESVLKRLRKTYHGLVADWLIANCRERIGVFSGLIATNLLRAERNKLACEYFNQAGDIALASFANSEAENYYLQGIKTSPEISQLAGLLIGLGEAMYRQGKGAEAQQIWEQSIELFRGLEDSNHLGDVYARLSKLFFYLIENYHQAWEICQEGLKSLEGKPDSPGYARLLAEAGRSAHFSKKGDQAYLLNQKALEMAEGLGDLEIWAEANINMTLWAFDFPAEQSIQKSINILEEVVTLTEAEGLLRSAARAHGILFFILANTLADLKFRLVHAERAVELSKHIGDIGMLKISLYNLAITYLKSGLLNNLEDVLGDYLQGLRVGRSVVVEVLSQIQNEIQFARGDWASALETSKEKVKSARESGNLQDIGDTNLDIADSLLEQERFGIIIDLGGAESVLLDNIENGLRSLQSHFLLSKLYAREARISKSQEMISHVKQSYGQYETNYSKVCGNDIEFEIAFAEELWEKGVLACEKSIQIYKNSGHTWLWARKLIDLGDALIRRNEPGDLERAREAFQQSLEMFTEMGAPGYIKVLEERLGNL